jgi:uncharacterized membrane protein
MSYVLRGVGFLATALSIPAVLQAIASSLEKSIIAVSPSNIFAVEHNPG